MQGDPTKGRLRALEMWLDRRLAKNDSVRKRHAESMRLHHALRSQQEQWVKERHRPT